MKGLATIYLTKVSLEHFAFGLTIPISIVWMLERNLSIADVAIIQSLLLITTLVSELPAGMLGDKFGRRTSLALGLLFHTMGLGAMIFADSFFTFLSSALLSGVAWAFISGSEEAYVHDTIAPTQENTTYKKLYSRVTIADEGATILGMVGTSLIVIFFTMQSVFMVATTVMGVTLLFLLVALPKDRPQQHQDPTRLDNPLRDARSLFTRYRYYLPIFIALALLFESARVIWQPHLVNTGWLVAELGFLFASLKVCSLIGSWIAAKIPTKSIKVLVYSGILGGVSLCIFAFSNQWVAMGALAFYFFFENIFRVNQSDYLMEISPNSSGRATFISGANLVKNLTSSGLNIGIAMGATFSIFATLATLLVLKAGASAFLWRAQKDK